MKKNTETLNIVRSKLTKSDVITARERFVGKYCYEQYRYVKDKYGTIIKQGMGLEGVITAIKMNKITKELIAEFDTSSTYCYCQLKWVTTDETLKDVVRLLNVTE